MQNALGRTGALRTLSDPELQVLRLTRNGNTTAEIANLMALSPAAARTYKASLYDKLGIAAQPGDIRLRELAAFQEADRQAPVEVPTSAAPGPESLQPSPQALAAVEADDHILAQQRTATVTTPVRTISQRQAVAYDAVPPAMPPRGPLVDPYAPGPVMMEPDPRPFWSRGPGLGAVLGLLIAAIAVAVLVALFVMHGNQPAPATPVALAPTAVAQTPLAQAPAPAQSPLVPAAAPAAPPPQAAAPQQPVTAPPPAVSAQPPAAVQPPAAIAPAPVAPAPAAPAPTLAPASNSAPSAAPSAATTPDTAPGTVLAPGQTWHQNGMDLTLSSPQLSSNGITLPFSLTNSGQTQQTFQFSRSNAFSATDNRNDRLTVSNPNYTYNFTLQPGATMPFDSSHPGGAVSFSGPVSSQGVNAITVTVNGIGGITNAQWRIPVQH